ncbi:uncharacterized protein LOC132901776 isoform X3 [Amyelois transitella]|uniref:uncharacterized protein LOC132901776 isoform X3 n=1 Tax=Amyelois transitella TaxID=680683 RepID=UPI00298FC117|nr:uncharacterized protein LOC132901776 isoform X3 [Amyelois transitella]
MRPEAGPSGIRGIEVKSITEEWLEVPSSVSQTVSSIEADSLPADVEITTASSDPSQSHAAAVSDEAVGVEVPSVVQAEAPPQPRRRCGRAHLTAAEARVQIVEAARQRAATEAAKFIKIGPVNHFKMYGEEPRDVPQDPAV